MNELNLSCDSFLFLATLYDTKFLDIFIILIDFREFISSLSVTTRGSLEEKLQWAFHIYDIDGDGYITQNELFSIVKAVQKMAGALDETKITKSKMVNIFDKMDTNQDSKLSLEEFIVGAKDDETLVHMLQAYTQK